MNALSPLGRIAIAIGAVLFVCGSTVTAKATPCKPDVPCGVAVYPVSSGPSWIFRPSTFSHDPETGARVAQYMRTPPVEPLEDERLVTSRYRRSRTNLRGADGSVDTYYEVQAWGNGRGGIDSEWERFHDAWKESYLQGGYYNQNPVNNGQWNHNGPWNNGGNWHHGGQWNNGGPGPGFPGSGNGGWGNGGWGSGGNNFPPNGPGGPLDN